MQKGGVWSRRGPALVYGSPRVHWYIWLWEVPQGRIYWPWLIPARPRLYFAIETPSLTLQNTHYPHGTLKISCLHSGHSLVPGLLVWKWVFMVSVMGMIPRRLLQIFLRMEESSHCSLGSHFPGILPLCLKKGKHKNFYIKYSKICPSQACRIIPSRKVLAMAVA